MERHLRVADPLVRQDGALTLPLTDAKVVVCNFL